MGKQVFISVAEPSADANGGLLAGELRILVPGVVIRGVGGKGMAGAGVDIVENTTEKSAMGLAAMGRAWEVKKLLGRVRGEWEKRRPDLVVCIDSWSMNYHFAKMAKGMGIPVLYYVAPQTWASREGRVKRLKAVVDHLACILPFEEMYFRGFGIPTTFVGHPLWDRIAVSRSTGHLGARGHEGAVVAILPGSRRGVVRANWPRLKRVMEGIRREIPGVKFRIPLAENAGGVLRELGGVPGGTEVKEGGMDEVLPGCDLAICVSGTAALHVAAHGVPMIVVYHGNPVLWHLIGRWLIRTRTYSLVNILVPPKEGGIRKEGTPTAREFIPWYGDVGPVVREAVGMLRSPERLAEMRGRLEEVTRALAQRGASHQTAKLAVELMEKGRVGR